MRSKEVIMGEAVKLRIGSEQIFDPVSLSILEALLDLRDIAAYESQKKMRGY